MTRKLFEAMICKWNIVLSTLKIDLLQFKKNSNQYKTTILFLNLFFLFRTLTIFLCRFVKIFLFTYSFFFPVSEIRFYFILVYSFKHFKGPYPTDIFFSYNQKKKKKKIENTFTHNKHTYIQIINKTKQKSKNIQKKKKNDTQRNITKKTNKFK